MAILLGVSPGAWVHLGLLVLSLGCLDLAVLPRVCLGTHISLRVPEYSGHPLGLSGHEGPHLSFGILVFLWFSSGLVVLLKVHPGLVVLPKICPGAE